MTRMLPSLVLLLCAVFGLVSCGPEGDPTPDSVAEARASQDADAGEQPETVEVGPVEPGSGVERADLRVGPEPLVTREETERAQREEAPRRISSNRVEPTPSTDGDALWRADGRPTWWVDRAGWRDGRYQICAEAFGADVRSARRAAIDAARRNAESTLGGTIRDERVETAIVRAVRGEGASSRRYVGYVRLTALRGE